MTLDVDEVSEVSDKPWHKAGFANEKLDSKTGTIGSRI
jgi:hypothetical protein